MLESSTLYVSMTMVILHICKILCVEAPVIGDAVTYLLENILISSLKLLLCTNWMLSICRRLTGPVEVEFLPSEIV
jgi:hypothetical protein